MERGYIIYAGEEGSPTTDVVPLAASLSARGARGVARDSNLTAGHAF